MSFPLQGFPLTGLMAFKEAIREGNRYGASPLHCKRLAPFFHRSPDQCITVTFFNVKQSWKTSSVSRNKASDTRLYEVFCYAFVSNKVTWRHRPEACAGIQNSPAPVGDFISQVVVTKPAITALRSFVLCLISNQVTQGTGQKWKRFYTPK